MIERITPEDANKSLIVQLESTLSRLALAAESHVSTYRLESQAKTLAGKIKASLGYAALPLYKGVTGSKVYSPEVDLDDISFAKYTSLCKMCGEALDVQTEDATHYVKISGGVYVNLQEYADQSFPQFKVKIEGSTLMAVRADLLAKLPGATKALLNGGNESE